MLKFLIFCYTDYNSSFTVFSIFGICSYFLCKGGGCVILELRTGSHFFRSKIRWQPLFHCDPKIAKIKLKRILPSQTFDIFRLSKVLRQSEKSPTILKCILYFNLASLKESSLCHKLKFSNSYMSAT